MRLVSKSWLVRPHRAAFSDDLAIEWVWLLLRLILYNTSKAALLQMCLSMPLQVSKHGLGFIVSFWSHLDPATAVACNGAILCFSGNTEHDVFLAALFAAEYFNPLAPISDRDRISPCIMNTISGRQVRRIKKNVN